MFFERVRMFKDVRDLLEKCQFGFKDLDNFEWSVYSRTPRMIREEFSDRIQVIQQSSFIQRLEATRWYLISELPNQEPATCVQGQDFLSFKVSFPDMHYHKQARTKEGVASEVEMFESLYLSEYIKGRETINRYKGALLRCSSFDFSSLVLLGVLYQRTKQEKEQYADLLATDVSNKERVRLYTLMLKKANCMVALSHEIQRRETRSGFSSKGT
jgi:hypothetical protein